MSSDYERAEADGIRIRIESSGEPADTRVYDSAGRNITGQVMAVSWRHEGADRIPYAEVIVGLVPVILEGNAVFKMEDGRTVSRIVYTDGSEDHYHPPQP